MKKKLLSLAVALAMVLSMLPTVALAAAGDETELDGAILVTVTVDGKSVVWDDVEVDAISPTHVGTVAIDEETISGGTVTVAFTSDEEAYEEGPEVLCIVAEDAPSEQDFEADQSSPSADPVVTEIDATSGGEVSITGSQILWLQVTGTPAGTLARGASAGNGVATFAEESAVELDADDPVIEYYKITVEVDDDEGSGAKIEITGFAVTDGTGTLTWTYDGPEDDGAITFTVAVDPENEGIALADGAEVTADMSDEAFNCYFTVTVDEDEVDPETYTFTVEEADGEASATYRWPEAPEGDVEDEKVVLEDGILEDFEEALADAVGVTFVEKKASEAQQTIVDALGDLLSSTAGLDVTVNRANLADVLEDLEDMIEAEDYTALCEAIDNFNGQRRALFPVPLQNSSHITDEKVVRRIELSLDGNEEVKSISNGKTGKPSELPEDVDSSKCTAYEVRMVTSTHPAREGGRHEFDYGFTYYVTAPSSYPSDPEHLRLWHYNQEGTAAWTEDITGLDGNDVYFTVNTLSVFLLENTSTGGGSGSGTGGGGSVGGVRNPSAAATTTPNVTVTTPAPSTVGGFTDVLTSSSFATEIAWAQANGIMGGYADGSFRPNNNTNRQQIWMVLARLAGANPADMAAARQWAIDSGISDGTNPESPLSRQQLITMLYRVETSDGTTPTGAIGINSYADAGSVASYAQEAIAWGVGNGIITGTTDGRLNPEGTATRAHFAAFLYRYANLA